MKNKYGAKCMIEKAKDYLKKFNMNEKIKEFSESSATVELAAKAVGVEPSRIAKTLSFMVGEKEGKPTPILIVCAGDAKIDNRKFKDFFHEKARMLTFDEVHNLIGHDIGGVCPFGINEGVMTYLDNSLKRFDTVFPAAGSSSSAIEFTCSDLEKCAQNFVSWVDVCKINEVVQ